MIFGRNEDKPVQLIADSDTDGTGVRICFQHVIDTIEKQNFSLHQSSASLIDEDIAKMLDKLESQSLIIISDLAPSPDSYNLLIENDHDVIVIDHHPSSYERIKNVIPAPDYVYDTERCSTKLCFDVLNDYYNLPVSLKEYADLVNIYDLYRVNELDFQKAKGLNNLLWDYIRTFNDGYDQFCAVQLRKIRSFEHFHFFDDELAIIKKEEEKENETHRKALKISSRREDSSGRRFLYTEMSNKISFVSSRILTENDDLDYVLVYNLFLDKRTPRELKFSLRSKENVDCSEIAERLGELGKGIGGGHKLAAGFTCKDEGISLKIRRGEITP